jgi:hypothetical protein
MKDDGSRPKVDSKGIRFAFMDLGCHLQLGAAIIPCDEREFLRVPRLCIGGRVVVREKRPVRLEDALRNRRNLIKIFRQSKVGEDDVPLAVDENIGRFDVAVNDPTRVKRSKSNDLLDRIKISNSRGSRQRIDVQFRPYRNEP